MNPLLLRALLPVVRFFWKWIFPVIPAWAVRALVRGAFSKSGPLFKRAVSDPAAAQREILLGIVRGNTETIFGAEHGFGSIASTDEWRRAVPIRAYDAFEPYLQRMADGEWRILTLEAPTFFGRTSGTTGAAKLIPITPSFREEFRRSRRIWFRQVALQFPGLVRGTLLTIHSPRIEGRTRGGIPFGSVTAGFMQNVDPANQVASGFDPIPMDVHHVEDFETRYYVLLRHALSLPTAMMAAVNPSTLVLLCRKLDEHADQLARDVEHGVLTRKLPSPIPDALRDQLEPHYRPDVATAQRIRASLARHGVVRPAEVWPRLVGLMCWKGGPAKFYLDQLPRWFGDLPVMCYGYCATEGSFSIPMDASTSDGVLAVMSHFLEFVEEDAWERGVRDTVLAHELEAGRSYRVVVTGSHGLYRYDINDVVECTGMHGPTPRVRFSHKGGTVVSITGEKLTEPQVVTAVQRAAERAGLPLVSFTVALRLGDPPAYVCAVEARAERPDDAALSKLAAAVDAALAEANAEYGGKRKSQRLGPARIALAPAGAFDAERARRVAQGSADAHVKIPHLKGDESIVRELRTIREVGPA